MAGRVRLSIRAELYVSGDRAMCLTMPRMTENMIEAWVRHDPRSRPELVGHVEPWEESGEVPAWATVRLTESGSATHLVLTDESPPKGHGVVYVPGPHPPVSPPVKHLRPSPEFKARRPR